MQTGIPQIFTIYAPPKQHLWDKTGCEAEFFSKLCSLELDTTQCFYFCTRRDVALSEDELLER